MDLNIITNFTRWFFLVQCFYNIKIHIISFCNISDFDVFLMKIF